MSSSFDSFDQLAGDSPDASTQSFDDGYVIYDPPLPNQGFDSFSNYADSESIKDSAAVNDSFTSQRISDTSYTPPIYISGNGFSPDPMEFLPFTPEENGKPILPPMEEMQAEDGFVLREWRRQNAIRLEVKEKREKKLLSQIIDDANEYKIDFYSRRKINSETNKSTNREKEKLFVASQEKFHVEADKNYWKTIAELVPNEVPAIEKKRGKKDQEKQTSVVVIQGPKPGKPTELSRMWHVLLKLKHNTPIHLRPSAQLATTKDAKTETPAVTPVAVA